MFQAVPTEKLDIIEGKLFEKLQRIVDHEGIDMERIQMIIKRSRLSVCPFPLLFSDHLSACDEFTTDKIVLFFFSLSFSTQNRSKILHTTPWQT